MILFFLVKLKQVLYHKQIAWWMQQWKVWYFYVFCDRACLLLKIQFYLMRSWEFSGFSETQQMKKSVKTNWVTHWVFLNSLTSISQAPSLVKCDFTKLDAHNNLIHRIRCTQQSDSHFLFCRSKPVYYISVPPSYSEFQSGP